MGGQVASANKMVNVTTNGNVTNLKSAPGTLVSVTINKKGASSNVLTLYDDAATGTSKPIATIDTTVQPGTLYYKGDFTNGLAYQLQTGTAADVTICFS